MSQERWAAIDQYVTDLLVPRDPALEAAEQAIQGAGLPPISVAPNQGKLLHILARLMGARTMLEIGTLGGYSSIWLARALPADGRLITLEIDPRHAEVARANIQRAGLSNQVEVRVGRAVDSLARLAEEQAAGFDLVFIDADKPSNPEYLAWALKLTHPGSLIVVDNVIRGGAVLDGASKDPDVIGVRRFNEMLAAEPRLSATELQTVGMKGHDGLAIALVVAAS
jgi:predicted O-methyltransferase YrrM